MNAQAIWDYEAQPKEYAGPCNLCGLIERRRDHGPDRYGYIVHVDTCYCCELVSLNPRMTKEAYAQFYESGAYRRLVSAYHGREINAQTIKREQQAYTEELFRWVKPLLVEYRPAKELTEVIAAFRPHKILDVGGSTGVVGNYFAGQYEAELTVLDPAAAELAEVKGEAIHSSIEDFDPKGRTWNLILFCQTADHVLDLAGALAKLRDCLSPNGWLFVDIVDYNLSKTVKIDHPFNLTPKTMRAYLEKAGFRGIDGPAPDKLHHRFLCRAL